MNEVKIDWVRGAPEISVNTAFGIVWVRRYNIDAFDKPMRRKIRKAVHAYCGESHARHLCPQIKMR